jgi:hypothetical protein
MGCQGVYGSSLISSDSMSLTACVLHVLFQLIGVPEETYVREVTFVIPSDNQQPAHILMASANLSLSNFLVVNERISYHPASNGRDETVFRQLALIQATGKLKPGGVWQRLGRKLEQWSLDRSVIISSPPLVG